MLKFQKWLNLNETVDKFHINDLSQSQADQMYEIFRKSYQQSTGASWDKSHFFNRAKGWEFYGTKPETNNTSAGFVSVRHQGGGLRKLVGAAGNPMTVARAAKEIANEQQPTWGMITSDMAGKLKRMGFIEPPPDIVKAVSQYVPALGQMINNFGDDGSMQVQVSGGLGIATKHFVGNKPYFQYLLKSPIMHNVPDEIKAKIAQL